jgi:hypothetical protein
LSIYGSIDNSKALGVTLTEYWRIVYFDLSDEDSFCDWTHEREWRIPGDFSFDLKKAIVVLSNHSAYRIFMKSCFSNQQQILKEILGIVNLSAVFHSPLGNSRIPQRSEFLYSYGE